MPDISLLWDPATGHGDWLLAGQDLAAGDDLETAVLVSLFTDRQADPDDPIPDGTQNRRGWWGDAGRARPLGSKLWLIERAKQTEQTRLQARDHIADALAWLVEDGVAASVDVVTSWQRPGLLSAVITIAEPDGSANRVFNYEWAWKDVS
jgi:phage gp46-like protein